jgi:acetoin utilization protein AcuB
MLARRISCLPVVDREDRLTGIFTTADGLRTAIAALAEEANQLRAEPTVAQLMTSRPLIVVGPKIALDQAAALIRDGRIRHVPILDGETLVGLLSDRDLLAHPGAERVADAMSTRLSTIAAERPAIEAARILSRRRIGALPVLRAGRLVGIVTSSDFLYWILAHV